MDSEPTREETLFAAALERPAEERRTFLQQACAGDAALLQRVTALVEAHEAAGSFLESEPPARPTRGPHAEEPGDRIDRYKLLQRIGEGGCGVVFMAEQETPIRRRVALKVIKLGMDTKEVVARFEAERQALALMDHPNIARVFDAGATATGRPYFVMELVRGTKITDYCDQHRLATTERLRLFVLVCQAVEHAHERGVLHRDLKPSNILVTLQDGVPTPKVIDFGIAKATEGRLTDTTLFTAFEQFIGTPAYMSPEQAEMSSHEVDRRTDIYSLGVLLYELLTGRTPFDPPAVLRAGLDEMRRQIRELQPPRPSTRLRTLGEEALSTAAQRRQTEALKLVHAVRGDLDWIVLKALEKDRRRRYDSAVAFADDVRRHLEHRPVAAHRPSAVYRIGKFIRRRATPLLAVAAVIAFATVFAWWSHREREQLMAARGSAAAGRPSPEFTGGKVGALGSPEQVGFTGNQTFSAQAIRAALFADSQFLLASHPEAPLADLVAATQAAVLRGYRWLGFVDATVSAQVDPLRQRLKLSIVEGPQIACGAARVQGVDAELAAELGRVLQNSRERPVDALGDAVETIISSHYARSTTPRSWKEDGTDGVLGSIDMIERRWRSDTAWKPGAPAPFSDTFFDQIAVVTRQCLGRRGFSSVQVLPRLEVDRAARRADLIVEVQLKQPLQIAAVTVKGNRRNTAADVVACSGLGAGLQLSAELIARAKLALWNSARFCAFDVRVQPPTSPSNGCEVVIEVDESDAAVPLREPLSRERAALVRLANWLTTELPARGATLTIEAGGVADVSLAVMPESLMAAYVEDPERRSLLGLLGRPQGVRLFGVDGQGAAGIDVSRWRSHPRAFVYLSTVSHQQDPARRASLQFGYGWSSSASTSAPMVIVSPVFACEYLVPRATARFEDGVVVLAEQRGSSPMSLRFREDTGELLEWRAVRFVPPDSTADYPRVSMSLGPEGHQRIIERIEEAWAQLPYDMLRRRSLADVILHSELARRLAAQPERTAEMRRWAAAIRLVERVLAAPAVRGLVDSDLAPAEPEFVIPADPGTPGLPEDLRGLAAKLSLGACRVLGASQQWPARVARELAQVVQGQTAYTSLTLEELQADPDMGPIGSMVTAQLLRLGRSPLAWWFARRALERSSPEDFRRDYQTLVEGPSPAAQLMREALPAMVDWTEPELTAVTAGMAADAAQLTRAAKQLLHGAKAEGVAATLRPLMEAWWQEHMQPDLPARLDAMLRDGAPLDPTIFAAAVNGTPLGQRMIALRRTAPEFFEPLETDLAGLPPLIPGRAPLEPAFEHVATTMLLLQDAAERGIDVSDAVVSRRVNEYVRDRHGGNGAAFEAVLAKHGMTVPEFAEIIRLNEGVRAAASDGATEPLAERIRRLRSRAFVHLLVPVATPPQ